MRRQWINAVVVLTAPVAALEVQAQISGDQPGFWRYGWDWGWGHMLFGSLMMLLFWGVIIVLIVAVVRWLGGGSAQGGESAPARNRALEVLQERYARGEIDREEYEQKRRDLTG
ncbi:MAG: SHOCT domain-containing protein [Proteobacteria bacterium]|nr:MAG: SHOCT domain-containing protein [Pseudomonadota bacterium]QKK12602.1 MAG: SHOCT domain-containing protein [Pseudomonadota bacterium]